MKANHRCLFLSMGYAKRFIQGSRPHATFIHIVFCSLLFLCIALVLSMPLTFQLWASEEKNMESYENLDNHWLPWIGSWRLVSSTINSIGPPLKEEYLLTIRPDKEGNFITMESTRDKTVMYEEKIETDGLRHPLNEDGCTGWYSYSWSETGNRLLFNGESSCVGDLSQKISGISIIDTVGDYVDIKLLKSGDEKAITVHRYQHVDSDLNTPAALILSKAYNARISAGKGFSLDEVIELSSKVEPEVLETALVEMHNPFPVNSKQLIRLSDAKVPSKIVDLVVALSFPEKFTVEKATLSWVKTSPSFMAPQYLLPISPWYWTPFACLLHDHRYYDWDWDWYLDWYLQSWWYPYEYGYINYGGGAGTDNNGKLVSGQGYTRTPPANSGSQRRYAVPRNAQATRITTNQSSSRSSGVSSSSATTTSSGTSSASSGASFGGSGSSSPSASPGGYSSGSAEATRAR